MHHHYYIHYQYVLYTVYMINMIWACARTRDGLCVGEVRQGRVQRADRVQVDVQVQLLHGTCATHTAHSMQHVHELPLYEVRSG